MMVEDIVIRVLSFVPLCIILSDLRPSLFRPIMPRIPGASESA
jgi:hypothetical protein